MAEIPIEAIIYVGLAFLSAITALTLTNTWQSVKTRTCLKRIEGLLGVTEGIVDDQGKKIEHLGKDVVELQTKDKIFHSSAVHPPG